jgi:hypothetical protein
VEVISAFSPRLRNGIKSKTGREVGLLPHRMNCVMAS